MIDVWSWPLVQPLVFTEVSGFWGEEGKYEPTTEGHRALPTAYETPL